MKKIFRMALVFALAGATLMYTGCSKDYEEDINNVRSSVTDLQNKLGELNNELSALKSSVSSLEAANKSLESAYKAADEALKKSIDANAADIKKLGDRVAAVEKAIEGLSKYATKDELKEAIAGVEKKLADAKAEIKAVTDGLQKQIDDLKAQITADEEAIKALQDAQKEIDNVYGFLSDELRGLVFQPDFYLGGVEATSYDFASFIGKEPVALKKAKEMTVKVDTSNSTKIVFPVGAKTEAQYITAQVNGKTVFPADMTQGQVGLATYDMNPSSFPVDSAEWAMIGRDVPYIVKSEAAKDWSIVVNEVVKNEANQAEVNFSIVKPENCFSTILAAFEEIVAAADTNATADARKAAAAAAAKANIADVQLQATLSNDRLVVSDWHAITSGEEFVDHLAFYSGNKYVTNNNKDCGSALDDATKMILVKDLYFNADSAAANIPSVEVQYNGGGKDLAELISIHTMENDTTFFKEYTLAQFNKKYPGFSYKFELVPYTIGNNVTSEEMYGQIDGTWFTPCYVESTAGSPKSIPIEKDSEDGISSVGRMPIVLAYLVNDETGYSYAVGYFKIIITKEEREPETRTYEIPGLSKVPYICGPFTLKTNWHEFSYFVLENLKVDYAEFIANYKLTGIWGYETLVKGKEESTAFVPIVEVSGDMTAPVELKLDNKTLPEAYAGYKFKYAGDKDKGTYGTAIYEKDKSGTGINDAFEWTVSPIAIGQDNSKSIFFRFESGPYDIVYFEMKADVAKAANFDFGANKISNEWYDDIDGEFKNTTRINVLVPNKTEDDVTEFYRDLNRFFIGYKPSVVLTDDSDAVYDNYFDPKADTSVYKPSELEGVYTFLFSADQPEIVFTDKDGNPITLVDSVLNDTTVVELSKAQLYVNDTFDTLYVSHYINKDGKIVENIDAKTKKAVLDTSHVIATLDTTGKITYYYDTTNVMSKKLLNLWSYTKTDQAQMLYANINVKTTYGECEIPAGDADFHVRFVRPLDVNFTAADVAEESAVAGFNVRIAQFLKDITDWNKQAVVKVTKDSKTGKVTKVEANTIAGVNMYKYYQFKKLILDLDNAQRDHWKVGAEDEKGYLKEVTPDAHLALGTVDSKGIFTDGGSNVLNIEDPASLMEAVLNYRNDRAVVETFNLFIPVSIEYAWGTIDEILEIKVKPTDETTPHSL